MFKEKLNQLSKQFADTTKDDLALLQEGSGLAGKELHDRLRHNIERQWIARVCLDQPLPLRRADERVHLDERRVLGDEGLPELDEDVDDLVADLEQALASANA